MNELTYEGKEEDEKGGKNKPLAFKSQRFVSQWLEDRRVQCVYEHWWLLLFWPADVQCVNIERHWKRLK